MAPLALAQETNLSLSANNDLYGIDAVEDILAFVGRKKTLEWHHAMLAQFVNNPIRAFYGVREVKLFLASSESLTLERTGYGGEGRARSDERGALVMPSQQLSLKSHRSLQPGCWHTLISAWSFPAFIQCWLCCLVMCSYAWDFINITSTKGWCIRLARWKTVTLKCVIRFRKNYDSGSFSTRNSLLTHFCILVYLNGNLWFDGNLMRYLVNRLIFLVRRTTKIFRRNFLTNHDCQCSGQGHDVSKIFQQS